MKQSTHLHLTRLSKKPLKDNGEYSDNNEDFEQGYEMGWHDAEIKIAQEILKMENEDEDEVLDGPQGI